MSDLHLRAPAKINLGLEVIRRRSDGFHDINTVFATVDVCDRIGLSRRPDGEITLRVSGNPELESGASNLCVRAAAALRQRLGDSRLGADIVLEKHIPIGAGLGGGSSDAAAVLRGVAELWCAHELGSSDLEEIGLQLGSDVPFFIRGGIAHARGRGERLRPLAISLPYVALLVNPGIHIPTPWAYARLGRTGERAETDLVLLLERSAADPSVLSIGLENDFEPAAFEAHPVLGTIKERLYGAGAQVALMSGSGATMFGLFGTPGQAHAAARSFADYWHAVGSIGEVSAGTT
ncbi:MAG TPA: 4-(cytidine 5'-diphospho)-2-C-methyl-D-erythritol kinase [Candidatus Kapabacteria bacterium]|nr:4-(cytidine 5'-diphospho)-2-C-methyl-D-erythritol kinase [Candidatus Kapabacteria bacterium]